MTSFGLGSLNSEVTSVYKNFTPGAMVRTVKLTRKIKSTEIVNIKMDKMPGFQFSWWYTGSEVTPDPRYWSDGLNPVFRR